MKLFVLLVCSGALWATEEASQDWKKVMALTKGTEVRIAVQGQKSVVEGKVDSVNEEAIVVLLKDEQRSVVREEIERLEFRNFDKTKRLSKEWKGSTDDTSANPIPPGQRLPGQSAVPTNMSSRGTVTLPSRGPWEALYQKAKEPKKR